MNQPLTIDEVAALIRYEDGRLIAVVNRKRLKAGDEVGSMKRDGYRRLQLCGGNYSAHHVVWLLHTGQWPSQLLDHIDRDRSNNRFSNLRPSDSLTNSWNKGPKAGKAFKGVTFHKKVGKYQAQIKVCGTFIYLGLFCFEADAARAYDAAAKTHFGEFARLNFSEGDAA